MSRGRSLIDRYYELLGACDVAGLTGLYGDGAQIVRFDQVAATSDEIAAFLDAFLRRHRNCSLRSIDQFRETDDIVMWDAMLDTDDGVLQSTHVVVLATDGTIHRHIPHVRGYWGS